MAAAPERSEGGRLRLQFLKFACSHETTKPIVIEKQMGLDHRRVERIWRGGGARLRRRRRKTPVGARRLDRLKTVADEARKAGAAEAHFHELDVSQTPSVETFITWVKSKIQDPGRQTPNPTCLHVLINNAGGAHGLDTVANGKDADWEAMIQANVLGVLRMTRAALPLMPRDAGASIINIGSAAGHTAYAGGAVYCAAKAGELQITRALRHELFGMGIRVGTVDPGLAETEFSLVRFKGDIAQAEKLYEGTHPLTAEDIADILVLGRQPPAAREH